MAEPAGVCSSIETLLLEAPSWLPLADMGFLLSGFKGAMLGLPESFRWARPEDSR